MRKWKKSIIGVLIILVAVLFVKCVILTKNFSQISGVNSSQVSSVTVHTNGGEYKTITSKADIKVIIDILNSARYSTTVWPPSTGYLYSISFYNGNNEIANITLSLYQTINDKKYIAFVDTDKIGKIVNSYP
jgi:uncharacterized protein YpmB